MVDGMKSAREKDIDYLVRLMGKNFKLKQYNRLINDKLFPEETFEDVTDSLMEYFIGTEEYEKCAEIKKLKKKYNENNQ
jgi:uncharacterized protein YihD (DUF1040 family)